MHAMCNGLLPSKVPPSLSSSLVKHGHILGFTAVKRHHDQGNSCKGQHLIRAALQVQRFSPLSSWQEACQYPGWHGSGGDENSTSCSKGSQEKTVLWAARMRVSKPMTTETHFLQIGHTHSNKATPTPNRPHPLQQRPHPLQIGHTHSNKATPPNSSTLWAKHIQRKNKLRHRQMSEAWPRLQLCKEDMVQKKRLMKTNVGCVAMVRVVTELLVVML